MMKMMNYKIFFDERKVFKAEDKFVLPEELEAEELTAFLVMVLIFVEFNFWYLKIKII